MNANNDKAKCAGQAPDGTMLCAYRERCSRFVRPVGDRQRWADFWKSGDDCPQYESVNHG